MMSGRSVNRVSGRMMVALSCLALVTVVTGYWQAPQADEGTAAHIFQLSIVLLLPIGVVFIATSDWTQPRRFLRPLILSAGAVVLAFGGLYYLERYWYR